MKEKQQSPVASAQLPTQLVPIGQYLFSVESIYPVTYRCQVPYGRLALPKTSRESALIRDFQHFVLGAPFILEAFLETTIGLYGLHFGIFIIT